MLSLVHVSQAKYYRVNTALSGYYAYISGCILYTSYITKVVHVQ